MKRPLIVAGVLGLLVLGMLGILGSAVTVAACGNGEENHAGEAHESGACPGHAEESTGTAGIAWSGMGVAGSMGVFGIGALILKKRNDEKWS